MNRFIVIAGAFLLAGPALAQPSQPAMAGMSGKPSLADRAMSDGMTRMSQSMRAAPMTGNADRDFVAMMIPHHAGAIDMAKVELQYGKDPVLRKLAQAIVVAQQKEIIEMRRWQAGRAQ